MPKWVKIVHGFASKWNFTHCTGTMDGKHVQILALENCSSMYYNYIVTFNTVLLAIAYAHYKVIYADVGCQGLFPDGGAFKHISFSKRIVYNNVRLLPAETLPGKPLAVPFVFVANDAFALSVNIIKPYAGHSPGSSLPVRISNYSLSGACRAVENMFGILSVKFSVFQNQLPHIPAKLKKLF
jgi:hypothetical protein